MKQLSFFTALLFVIQVNANAQIWDTTRVTNNAQRLLAISFPDSLHGWMVGHKPGDNRAYIIQTADGGENWTEQQSAISDQLQDVHFKDSLRGWTLGLRSVQKTVDGGTSWDSVDLGEITTNPRFVDFDFEGETVYAIGDGGSLFKSTDEAESWEERKMPEEASFYTSVDFINPDTGFAVGGQGSGHFLTRTFDGGDSWEIIEVNQAIQGSLLDLVYVDDTLLYTCGAFGKVLRSEDGGTTWDSLPRIEVGGQTVKAMAIWFMNADTGWIASEDAFGKAVFIHRTNDAGQSWIRQLLFARSPKHSVNDLTFDPSGVGWACGHQEGFDLNGEVILRGAMDTVSSIQIPEALESAVDAIRIYPNPVEDIAQIELKLREALEVRLRVYSMSGQLVRSLFAGRLSASSHTFELDSRYLQSGSYLLCLEARGYVITRRVIVVD